MLRHGGFFCTVLALYIAICGCAATNSEEKEAMASQIRRANPLSNLLSFYKSQGAPLATSEDEDQEDNRNWELVFFDDFEGDTLNSSNWNIRRNESHGLPPELELYLANNVKVQDGTVILTTKRETATGPHGKQYNYTSGWIDSKGKQFYKYGKWEIRAKLPQQESTGSWPAHWLLPQPQICWPVGGEIDIMEATSNPFVEAIFGSYRWGKKCGDNKQVLPGSMYPAPGGPKINYTENFHVFGVEWSADMLRFSVDGTVYHTRNSSEVPIPQTPFYIILDTAVAWYLPPSPSTPFPATHIIDWVKLYQRK